MQTYGTVLAAQLRQKPFLTLPGVYDCLSAQMAKNAGFEALFFSGGSFSIAALGVPDIGFYNPTDALAAVERIVDLTELPLIVDADNGFGNAIHAARFAKRLLRLGAAGLQIDDQQLPQTRPGTGKASIEWDLVAPKIKAVKEAVGDDLFLLFRTVRGMTHGIDQAVERVNRAAELGCHMAYVDGLKNLEEVRQVASDCTLPLLANMNEKGFCASLAPQLIRDLGFKAGLFPVSSMAAAALAMERIFQTLKTEGTTAALADSLYPVTELYDRFGLGRLTRTYGSLYDEGNKS